MLITNSDIAELLAREGDAAEGHRQRAYRNAAVAALEWPVECSEMLEQGESLDDLDHVGPHIARKIERWLGSPPDNLEPDPLRADFLSWPQAQRILAAQPKWMGRCLGDLQMHSTWSDGGDKIETMALAGLERGYQYLAITDHTKGLAIAGGIDEAALRTQAKEIATVNRKLAKKGHEFCVLHAVEMNLSPEGQGDMDPDSLVKLDLVLGSFHSKLRGTGDQTERYVRALSNPDIQILAHPRGRKFNGRLGLKADWPLVFAAAKHFGKAVEIDGYPDRQDLNRDLLRLAKEAGVYISLGSDSHHAHQLRYLEYSLAAALESGISPSRILNFMPAAKLLEWVESVRAKAGRS